MICEQDSAMLKSELTPTAARCQRDQLAKHSGQDRTGTQDSQDVFGPR